MKTRVLEELGATRRLAREFQWKNWEIRKRQMLRLKPLAMELCVFHTLVVALSNH